MSAINTRFIVTVDGKTMSMIMPPGTTLEQARGSATTRFGAHRVREVRLA